MYSKKIQNSLKYFMEILWLNIFSFKEKRICWTNNRWNKFWNGKKISEIFKQFSAKLNEMKFDNSEVALECFLLKKMVKILDDIIKEIRPNLSEKDKKAIFDLFLKNDDEKKDEAP